MKFLLKFALLLAGLIHLPCSADAENLPDSLTARLPNTAPLELNEPLDVVMVRGLSKYAERALTAAGTQRRPNWLEHSALSPEGKKEREAARNRLRSLIGDVPTETATSRLTRFSPTVIDHPKFTLVECQWDVADGITGRGLLAIPKSLAKDSQQPLPCVVVLPDVNETPEASFGIDPAFPSVQQVSRQLAEAGCVVLCPVLIDRQVECSGHPLVRWTNLPHREFIYRLGFELGRHPVGYEVAKIRCGIDALRSDLRCPLRTVVIGTGEGGLIAMMVAAASPESIDAAYIRGYFNERDRVWEEPIYRNLFGQLKEFGDAEIASLILPRPLVIDNVEVAIITGPEKFKDRHNCAAPGQVTTPERKSVRREFEKALGYTKTSGPEGASPPLHLLTASDEEPAETNNSQFARAIHLLLPALPFPAESAPPTTTTSRATDELREHQRRRMKSQVEELVRDTQHLLHSSHLTRQQVWKDLKGKTTSEYAAAAEKYRTLVHESFIGRAPTASVPPRPRSRKVLETADFTGYEIVLDVHPPGVKSDPADEDWGGIAGGILLLPKSLRENEKRPVVVFQHGLEGTPMYTIVTDPKHPKFGAYQGVSSVLAQRGFIVYVPQNPYRGGDLFRVVQRKLNPLGLSLFSHIIEQHQVTLNWLASLPCTDPDRIAFYGISYGGKTAVRVPPLLPPRPDQAGYCLSICSADFNDWIRKNASAEDRYSYVFTGEYEIFEWNMGHVANYAELTWLMLPRPFMVERGLDDGVAPDDWVAAEFATAARPYRKLQLDDQIEFEVFDGPHAIHGVKTYEFLHRHLNWPAPKSH